jgi:hypothetical protein
LTYSPIATFRSTGTGCSQESGVEIRRTR